MRAGSTELLEVIPLFSLFAFDYILMGSFLLHLPSLLALFLQVAVLLKAAQ
jgi:hypothetical protein